VRENRVVEAISTYLVQAQGIPAPRSLAQVVGAAVGAAGCALTIAGERYQWGGGTGPWLECVVEYGGEPQGVLAVTPRSAVSLAAITGVLGPPLAALRLAEEADRLRREGDAAARELVDDRWRAAAEMEQERRGLERDLHDGAQHHLVALRMSLALVEHAITTGGAREPMADLLARLDTAERVLLDTAAGVAPITLVSGGLAAALIAELANHDDVVLDIRGLRRRYSPSVESAVYFVCLEAVNNAHKHAPGARITVTAQDNHNGLRFVVADTGPGFAVAAPNSGLHNLSARAAAVGGTIEVRSAPGRGTAVTGFVPG
jgi:signal transduction histidine kinase